MRLAAATFALVLLAAVPDSIVLRRHDNPTGGAVLCIDPIFRAMLCFVPGTQM
jgi:hypothetical protein